MENFVLTDKEKILQDARDIMLECGFPTTNDFRTIGTTPWARPIQTLLKES